MPAHTDPFFFNFPLGSHRCRPKGMVGSRTTLEAQHIFPWSAAEFEWTGRGGSRIDFRGDADGDV